MAVFALLIFTIDVTFTCGLEYYIEVPGGGASVPFWVPDHLMEKLS